MTDEKIVDMFFKRNEAAIASCDIKYGRPLRSFGERITGDTHTAEECVNDTYMKTWQTVPPKNPKSYLFAYLSKILRNLCFDRIRALRREKRDTSVTVLSNELTEAAPDTVGADAEAIRNELSELIEKFLSALTLEKRHIFVLRYFYMEEVKSIAKRLSLTEGKVKTVLKRTRDELKLFLESHSYRV